MYVHVYICIKYVRMFAYSSRRFLQFATNCNAFALKPGKGFRKAETPKSVPISSSSPSEASFYTSETKQDRRTAPDENCFDWDVSGTKVNKPKSCRSSSSGDDVFCVLETNGDGRTQIKPKQFS